MEKPTRSKGGSKEAAGVLTDNDRLKRKGKLDQVVGKVKETAEKAVDKMKESLTSNRPRGRAKYQFHALLQLRRSNAPKDER